jgi:transcriptional regulator with XRE-family HTH domain
MSNPVRVLKRLRLLRGMKQSHVAELLKVTQATVSRWERGLQLPSPDQEQAMLRLLTQPLCPGQDRALRRLVESSSKPVHLICDLTHRLLAVSGPRAALWRVPAGDMYGHSLWRFATPEIREAEARLEALGWDDETAPMVAVNTGAALEQVVPIIPGWMLWERIRLEDGHEARLVTTPERGETLPEGAVVAA